MVVHATCVARDGQGLLIRGPSGCGKSQLALRLMSNGFDLVADDRVHITENLASPVPGGSGLMEIRGLGIYRVGHLARAKLVLVVLDGNPSRLAEPLRCELTGLPMITVRFEGPAATDIVQLSFDCVQGRVVEIAGPIIR